jgi:pimeloyl-ACP methyl ester carboxylesterase
MNRRWAIVVVTLMVAVGACGGDSGGGSDGGAAGGSAGRSGGAGGAEPDPIDAASPGERSVQVVGANKVRLFGTFTSPPAAQSASVPGVLLVPTTGPGDRNGLIGSSGAPDRIAQDMAQAFSGAGVASYRYDRRGTGESKLEPDMRLSFADLVTDAKAALDLLAQRRETSGRDLAVVGYDLGGLVATRLAATDPRVKRLVLVSTPGGAPVEMQAAQLRAVGGQPLEDALRSTVANLLATKTLPSIDALPAELRPLFPPVEAPFLAELYGMDGAAEAAKVRVPTMVVTGADATGYDPARLAAAVPGAQMVTSPGSSTLVLTGALPADDPSNPASATHVHGAGPPVAATKRDADALGRITGFLTASP